MATRSKRLGLALSTIAFTTVVLTVPDNRTAILKDWSYYNFSGAAANFYLGFRVDGVVPTFWFDQVLAVPNDGVRSVNGRFVVLEEADTVVCTLPATSQVMIFGALLLGDPA